MSIPKEQTEGAANVPADVTAMQAKAIVQAAITWTWRHQQDHVMDEEGWVLLIACEEYGDKYKGLGGV